jgi:hypothetical protein
LRRNWRPSDNKLLFSILSNGSTPLFTKPKKLPIVSGNDYSKNIFNFAIHKNLAKKLQQEGQTVSELLQAYCKEMNVKVDQFKRAAYIFIKGKETMVQKDTSVKDELKVKVDSIKVKWDDYKNRVKINRSRGKQYPNDEIKASIRNENAKNNPYRYVLIN